MALSHEYLGLTKKAAQNLAEKRGLIFRLISVDGEGFLPYPDDARDDRVCVEIQGGQVTKATVR